MFSLICAWTNIWANNGDAVDFKCHHAHYDIIVIKFVIIGCAWSCQIFGVANVDIFATWWWPLHSIIMVPKTSSIRAVTSSIIGRHERKLWEFHLEWKTHLVVWLHIGLWSRQEIASWPAYCHWTEQLWRQGCKNWEKLKLMLWNSFNHSFHICSFSSSYLSLFLSSFLSLILI